MLCLKHEINDRPGTLVLHGAYFDVTTGILSDRDPVSGEFKPYLKH